MHTRDQGWFLLRSGSLDAASNMAWDEALLHSAAKLGRPVLRFYGWTEPAASFGYFQKYAEVGTKTHLRPLVRRPTAGGMVPHDADWTYSVTIPPGDSWYTLKALESYRRMHSWQRSAFLRMGMETELAPCCKKSGPGQCFVGHEQFDLLWYGSKIAGAAQRRNRDGLLIQGSVQPPPDRNLNRADWETAMLDTARDEMKVGWHRLEPEQSLNSRVDDLVRTRYSRVEFNQKR